MKNNNPNLAVSLIVVVLFSGCFGINLSNDEIEEDIVSNFDSFDPNSYLTIERPTVEPVYNTYIEVDLPIESLGAAAIGLPPRLHAGLWIPETPNGTEAPTVVVFSADYNEKDRLATQPSNRLGGLLLERLISRGFAIMQVAAFGTSFSTHCVDFLGQDDYRGIVAALDWITSQSWSNGDVYVVGEDYGGAMAWIAAASQHDAVKGVVAMDAPTSVESWLWHDGAARVDAWTTHPLEYGPRSVDSYATTQGGGAVDGKDVQTLCASIGQGAVAGPVESSLKTGGSEYVNYYMERNWTGAITQLSNVPILVVQGMGMGRQLPSTSIKGACQLSENNPVDLLLGPWHSGLMPGLDSFGDINISIIGNPVAQWIHAQANAPEKTPGLHSWVLGEGTKWHQLSENSNGVVVDSSELTLETPIDGKLEYSANLIGLDFENNWSVAFGSLDFEFNTPTKSQQIYIELRDKMGALHAWGIGEKSANSLLDSINIKLQPTLMKQQPNEEYKIFIRGGNGNYMPSSGMVKNFELTTDALNLKFRVYDVIS